jgi:protein gp37
MGEVTKISWTHHTFNPWTGCEKVSDGCKNCYAATMSRQTASTFGQWGKNGTRVKTSESYWAKPLAWNKKAEKEGVRHRVFCASMADFFEEWSGLIHDHKGSAMIMAMDDLRLGVLALIAQTPWLDWLILTKRPDVIEATLKHLLFIAPEKHPAIPMLTDWIVYGRPYNVWLGTSVEDQETADYRIPHLLKAPARIHWISYEPALAPVDFSKFTGIQIRIPGETGWREGLDWIVCGGESGHGARPFDVEWARSTIDQCAGTKTACYVKQMGAKPIETEPDDGPEWPVVLKHDNAGRVVPVLHDKAGADWDEWPDDLKVREFPT